MLWLEGDRGGARAAMHVCRETGLDCYDDSFRQANWFLSGRLVWREIIKASLDDSKHVGQS